MMLDSVGTAVMVASLLSLVPLALAWLLSHALVRQRPSVRHHLWVVAITIALLAPAARFVAPRLDVPLLWTSTPAGDSTRAVEPPAFDLIVVPDTLRQLDAQESGPTDDRRELSRPPWSVATLVAIVWLAGAAPIAFLCALRRARLARIVAAAQPWNEAVRIRAHDAVAVPMLAGVRHPTILLPVAAADWPAEELEGVLAHERGHQARWDHITTLICEAATALYWLNPLVWIGAAALEHERERACDEEVLRAGIKPSIYAAALLRIEHGLPRRTRFTGAPAISGGRLDARIRAVLADAPRPGGVPMSWLTTAALVITCALIVGSVHLVARSSPGQIAAPAQPEVNAITVLGEIRMPLRIAVAGSKSLLEALAEAGGPTSQAGHEAEVVHNDGTRTVVDLRDVSATHAYLLRPGDVVLIGPARSSPLASESITLLGEIRMPGRFAVTGSKSLLEALAEAGAPTNGAGEDVEIIHANGKRAAVVNLTDVSALQTYKVRAGDIVNVPKARVIYINGEVRNQGVLVFWRSMTLEHVVTLAGGLTERGTYRGATVARGEAGKTREIAVNERSTLLPDDVIRIPRLR